MRYSPRHGIDAVFSGKDTMEQYEAAPPPVGLSAEEKQWGMFGHLSALTGIVTGGLGNFLGPLIVWQMKKDSLPFAAEQAKEALNFNITLLIVGIVFGVVVLATAWMGVVTWAD